MMDTKPSVLHRVPRSRWSLALLVFLTAIAAALPLILPAAAAPAAHAHSQPLSDTAAVQAPASVAGSSVMLFQANLSGAAEAPPAGPLTDTQASGWALMALNTEGMTPTLYYRVMVNDIDNITMAHIHEAPVGVSGGVRHWLYDGSVPFDPQNPVSGTVELSDEDVSKLMAGVFYVNVHTEEHPGGEIRGQLEPWTPPTSFHALLLGRNEVPARETDAEGVAMFTLNGDSLDYEIHVRDIMSITMSHIHRGWPNQNGGVIHWLWGEQGETRPFGPGNPISGTITGLTAQDMVDLLTGYYYVNVHTDRYPPGEIRGQIGGAHAFEAVLSGDNEVPPVGPVDTPASGRAVLVLSADTSTLHYRITVDDIMSITMSHIHRAPPDENGPVVHWLYDGSVPFDPAHPVSGTIPFSPTSVLDMIEGTYYVNVHTEDHPGGEIRGQISDFAPPETLTVPLSGQQEVPESETDASGVAKLTLDPLINRLFYQVEVSDIMSITMSHFHEGMAGTNGPVRHWLFPHATDRPGTIDNNAFAPGEPIGGGIYLDGDSLLDLLTNFYYVNVHTERYPPGELRGQVVLDPSVPTAISLQTIGAVPAVPVLPLTLAALGLTALAGAGLALARRRR
ncbi:MAG TPA: CHRD domain-containing protein [Ardenticatenaceae bacterium]